MGKKAAQFFYGLFDFSTGTQGAAGGGNFYPTAQAGQAAPPVNLAYADTGAAVTPKSTLGLSAAWACTWLIAETISTLPFILNKKNGPTYGAPALDNALYPILNSTPNAQMSACELWMTLIASELLWGNGYAQKQRNGVGEIVGLDPMRPEFVTPYRDQVTKMIRYKYYPPGQDAADFAAEDIFHLKGRTMDGLVGLSRVEYARNSLGIAHAADTATSDTFRNGLRSGGFVTYDKFLKEEQRKQIGESLQTFTTGGQKSGGMMVLEGGMGFSALTMNPQDVQLLASRQFAIEDICRWFGVPPVLIGHAAAGVTSWGTGIEQLLMGWTSLSLRPFIRRIEQTVSRSLILPADRAKYYLTIDTDDLLGADSTARAALYSTYSQNGIMTRNEIRAREDLAPVVGGDVLTVQSNLIPIDKLGQTAPPPAVPAIKPIPVGEAA